MATFNKDFRIKHGIVVEGSTATVNGNNVLTTASSLDSLGDVVITSATPDQVLKYNGTNWVNGTASGGSSSPYETVTTSSSAFTLSAPTVVNTSSQDAAGSTSMTFTLPASMQQGDICIVLVGSDTTQPDLPSGWTDFSAITYGGGYQRTIYKVMGSTPDSTVSLTNLSSSGATAVAIAIRGYVGTPSITTATGLTTGMPNPPSVTTTLNNSLVIALGAIDDDAVATVTAPSGYSNLVQEDSTGRTGMTTMLATKVVSTAGSEDPAAFGGSGSDDWYSATIVVAPGSEINFDVSTSQINYYTSNLVADTTVNFRGNGSTTLNSLLTTDQSVTCALLLTNGSTAYKVSTVEIDGTVQTIKWISASAPSGSANSIDSYVFTIIKTATDTYTVLGSKSRYA